MACKVSYLSLESDILLTNHLVVMMVVHSAFLRGQCWWLTLWHQVKNIYPAPPTPNKHEVSLTCPVRSTGPAFQVLYWRVSMKGGWALKKYLLFVSSCNHTVLNHWIKPPRHWVTKLSQNFIKKQGNKAYWTSMTAAVKHLSSLFHLHVSLDSTAAPSGASILEEQRSREDMSQCLSSTVLTHQTIRAKLTSHYLRTGNVCVSRTWESKVREYELKQKWNSIRNAVQEWKC